MMKKAMASQTRVGDSPRGEVARLVLMCLYLSLKGHIEMLKAQVHGVVKDPLDASTFGRGRRQQRFEELLEKHLAAKQIERRA